MDLDCQNVCASCWELLNHVDECECKLMALQNEVSEGCIFLSGGDARAVVQRKVELIFGHFCFVLFFVNRAIVFFKGCSMMPV